MTQTEELLRDLEWMYSQLSLWNGDECREMEEIIGRTINFIHDSRFCEDCRITISPRQPDKIGTIEE